MLKGVAAVRADPRTAIDLAIMYVGFAVRTSAPVALIPLLGRVLGAENYGLFAIAGTVTLWVWQITEAGLPTTASREIAVTRDTAERSRIASASVVARSVMAIPGLAVAFVMIAGLPQLRDAYLISGLSIVLGLQSALNLGWLFMASGRRRLLSAAETLPPLLTLFLCFLFVTERDHTVRALVIMNLSALATNVIFWLLASRFVTWKWPRWEAVRRELVTSFSYFILRVAGLVNGTISIYLLGLMTTNTEVAHFSVAEKVISACLAMFGPIYQTIFPLTMQHATRPREVRGTLARVAAGILALSVLGSAMLWLSSYHLLAVVMGPQYEDAAVFIRWLVWLIPLSVASQLLVNCVLMPLRRDRVIVALNLVLTVLGSALSLFLVWRFDAPGMVASRIIGTLVGFTAMLIVARRVLAQHDAAVAASPPNGA